MKKGLLLSFLLLTACQNQNVPEQREMKTGMAYHKAHSDDAICVASVYLEDDVIMGATIDELTYLSGEEYDNLLTSEQTTTQKHISSKVENNELYSQAMELNGSTKSIKENFEIICKYVEGKTVKEIENELENNEADVATGCTLQSKSGYVKAILEACKQAK